MRLKTIFNRVKNYKPFIVDRVELTGIDGDQPTLDVTMRDVNGLFPSVHGTRCFQVSWDYVYRSDWFRADGQLLQLLSRVSTTR